MRWIILLLLLGLLLCVWRISVGINRPVEMREFDDKEHAVICYITNRGGISCIKDTLAL